MARWYAVGVVGLWLVCMSWLMATRVVPLLRSGQGLNVSPPIPNRGEAPLVDAWSLQWNERRLGWSISLTRRRDDGLCDVRSAIHLDQFPIEEFTERVLGPVAWLLRTEGTRGPSNLSFEIKSLATFQPDGSIRQFDSTLDIDEFAELARIRGEMKSPGRLAISVRTLHERTTTAKSEYREVFQQELDIPLGAQVNDSLTPQSRLTGLELGQSWTFPVYRAFPPNSSVQLVEAKAEKRDVIFWNGESIESMLVVFRRAGGSDLAVSNDVLGRLWVREDGKVLVQELNFASTRFRFERLEEAHMPETARTLLKSWKSTSPAEH